MTEPLITRDRAEAELFGTRGSTCLFAPIRHHSPACAWMLRAMIRDHAPEVILIEMPADLAAHIPHLTDPETVAPVAIAALGPEAEAGRSVAYYPFSDTSPELMALREAARLGAEVRFIDLATGARVKDDARPIPQPEDPFDTAAFIAASCQRLGLRDGNELWDHLFEVRLGEDDWRRFFADVHAYCLAIRETTPKGRIDGDDTRPREAAMRAHIAACAGKRMVVVTGGFHTPALIGEGSDSVPKPDKSSESYLISYGEEALDALSGYAAGLRHPAWYARAMAAAEAKGGPPDWDALLLETGTDFAAHMKAAKRRIAQPQLVEMLTMAKGLAAMKGRTATLLPDLFDGARTALIKGQAGPGEPFTEGLHAFLRGTRLGTAPRAAGRPPIVADARDRAGRARIDLDDSTRKARKLDIRRKPAHRAASQFLHQMNLLDTGFASLTSGPDFVTGSRVDLLFEEWDIGWSPFVEGRLIDVAHQGATVPQAAGAVLLARRAALFEQGRGDDIAALLTLVITGLRAGLGARLSAMVGELTESVTNTGDLAGLAAMIDRLQAAAAPGDPLHDADAPDLLALARRAFDRLVYLCADLPDRPDDELDPAIAALRTLAGVLRGPNADRFEGNRFDAAMEDILQAEDCPPRLMGAVMGLLVRAGRRDDGDLARLLSGSLRGIGGTPDARAAALDGLLTTAPMLLWQARAVLEAANATLIALDDDGFLALLPSLRRSLTALNPHETDRLAEELTLILGENTATLGQRQSFSEADLHRGMALDRALGEALRVDGLA
ncbi:DUF5682 family protein [Jannaschia pohangensis]|uniref:Uncharacterized protein n=1 Tax=Jannaschia pohangensis TaxID=390807 RepID=A0A1I3T9T2_9RHOB|nr:DUF5682 family protein [Jannaschia pohangensis]SFJ67262.1 hypothetical protein SAMN04488095_3340 [Jannaschia pohangensis]